MGYLIAAAIFAISIVLARKERKKAAADLLEVNYTQTSAIRDAVDVMSQMSELSSGARHYVELKGRADSELPPLAPYSRQPVAYYKSKCMTITEETSVNNGKTSTNQTTRETASETSSTPFYIKDGSCSVPVYIDIASFGDNIRLIESCNRMEPPGSSWCAQNSCGSNVSGGGPNLVLSVRFESPAACAVPGGAAALRFFDRRPGGPPPRGGMGGMPRGFGNSMPDLGKRPVSGRPASGRPAPPPPPPPPRSGGNLGGLIGGMMVGSMAAGNRTAYGGNSGGGSRFLGYRLIEETVPIGQDIYVLGDLSRRGDQYWISASADASKPSFFSCKSEEELVSELKGRKSGAVWMVVIGALIALLVLWLFGG